MALGQMAASRAEGRSPSGLRTGYAEMLKACAWNILPLKNWVSSEQEPVQRERDRASPLESGQKPLLRLWT